MRLNIYNDTKEKHNSFEAWVELSEEEGVNFPNIEIERGYGRDEESAISDYFSKLKTTVENFHEIAFRMIIENHDRVQVNHSGKPI